MQGFWRSSDKLQEYLSLGDADLIPDPRDLLQLCLPQQSPLLSRIEINSLAVSTASHICIYEWTEYHTKNFLVSYENSSLVVQCENAPARDSRRKVRS